MKRSAWLIVVLAVLAAVPFLAGSYLAADPEVELQSAEAFAAIDDPAARSVALFEEVAKVLTHPRCINCHPAGDSPHQGEDGSPHQPPVLRGADGHGVVGMRCATCHHGENFDPGQVPGAPHWHLAPLSMAWEGLSVGDICRQIQDRERNGDRSLDEIVRHMQEDSLVLWAWEPGVGREPAPGNPATFGALVAAWAEAGAACPE